LVKRGVNLRDWDYIFEWIMVKLKEFFFQKEKNCLEEEKNNIFAAAK